MSRPSLRYHVIETEKATPRELDIPAIHSQAIVAAARAWAKRRKGSYCNEMLLGRMATPYNLSTEYWTSASSCSEYAGCGKFIDFT